MMAAPLFVSYVPIMEVLSISMLTAEEKILTYSVLAALDALIKRTMLPIMMAAPIELVTNLLHRRLLRHR